MKRKLSFADQRDNTSDKMMKWNETQLKEMNVSDHKSISGGRRLNFKLTEKKATSNLLKAADREHVQIETKQNCTNFRFSTGAYILVAKKLIKECEDRFKNGTPIAYTDMNITVDEFKTGLELNNKHFDTKIVFHMNGKKVVMHCYNSTQNLKIEGAAYLAFIEKYFTPIIMSEIEAVKEKIITYDSKVIVTLGKKKGPLKGKTTKKVRSIINHCKKCDKKFETNNALRQHKFVNHTATNDSSLNSENSLKHSTRNDSMSELLLCEDITISSLPPISCEEENQKKSITPERKNEDEKSRQQTNVVSEEITTEKNPENKCYCYLCEFETNNTSTLENHYATEHKTIYCDKCEYTAVRSGHL